MIYNLNLFLLIIENFVFLQNKKLKNGKILFCVISCIQWILISGLRHVTIGADTKVYEDVFINIKFQSFPIIWLNVLNIKYLGQIIRDPGYALFVKIFQLFSDDYQIYLIFIAILFTVPLTIWIYKNSKDVFISFLIYSVLFYSFFSITGIRQTIATVLSVFIASKFLFKKNIYLYLLFIFIGSIIHKSCLIIFFVYFLQFIKFNKNSFYIYLILLIISILSIPLLNTLLTNLDYYSNYMNQYDGAGTYTFSACYILIIIFSMLTLKYINQDMSPMNNLSYHGLFIGLILLPLTYINPSNMRIIQYFSIYIIILIPNLLDCIEYKQKIIIKYLICILLFVLLLKNNPHYLFYWQ